MTRGLRRSLLAAAVFILAGIGGVVGGHVTDKFTSAAVAFVVLLILGALGALILDRLSGDSETAEAFGATVTPSVDARWARAVQIGDHNIQLNQGDPPGGELRPKS